VYEDYTMEDFDQDRDTFSRSLVDCVNLGRYCAFGCAVRPMAFCQTHHQDLQHRFR